MKSYQANHFHPLVLLHEYDLQNHLGDARALQGRSG
jgi:hypothetical protein